MNVVYLTSLLVLAIAIALTAMVFTTYRKRLAAVDDTSALNEETLRTTFTSTAIEQLLGYALIGSIAFLIWQTIQQGFDFSLLMIGAMLFTGTIYLIDFRLTQKARQTILKRAAAEVDSFDEKNDKTSLEPGLIENSRAFFPILVLVFVLRSFLIEPFQIPSGSMMPTLEIRDFILVNRFAYGVRVPVTNKVIVPVSDPKPGDVIVFKPPHEPSKSFIKRVIAVPGDTLQYNYETSQITLNGVVIETQFKGREQVGDTLYRLYEETIGERTHQLYQDQYPKYKFTGGWIPQEGVTVPEGKYFVMGDNRDNSADARFWESSRPRSVGSEPFAWGFVDEGQILGKAFVIWMHWEGFYPSFARSGFIQ